MAPRAVSCIRPTGGLHIGQYFGAVSRWPGFQDSYQCFFGIGDLHQMTLPYRSDRPFAQASWARSLTTAAELFACGVDPLRSLVFLQSLIPEHTELCWLLACVCSYGELPRMPLFKQNHERYTHQRGMVVSAALLNYPLLQAADILIYKGELVPVGGDQQAHIELARKLARGFNKLFAGVFPIPKPDYGQTPKIMALQAPDLKMSRNRGDKNVIGLFEDETSIRTKIEKAKTSSGPLPDGSLSPGVKNLLAIYGACRPHDSEAIKDDLSNGTLLFKEFKSMVAEALVVVTKSLHERRSQIDLREVEAQVLEMSGVARLKARETLVEVKEALRLPAESAPRNNWWRFDVKRSVREDPESRNLTGYMEVNPERNGRRRLSYRSYLGLGQLLACQVPTSRVPDERVFIITHQIIELVFKQMIFDLAVVASTCRQLLAETKLQLVSKSMQPDDPFWRPALTASGRLEHSATVLLPSLMDYLSEDEFFSGIEFFQFRENLAPASGFQSAQFRLLQRALGKSRILEVRLFPGEVYRYNYGLQGERSVKVVDEAILLDESRVASPIAAPLLEVANLDELMHELLGRLAPPVEEVEEVGPVPLIREQQIERAVEGYQSTLREARTAQRERGHQPSQADLTYDKAAVETFRTDLADAIHQENERRLLLTDARRGAVAVQRGWGVESHLKKVLDRLIAVDRALHGSDPRSFLGRHYHLAKHRIEQVQQHAAKLNLPDPPSGTGGGGIEYLAYSRKLLLQLFPALVAYGEDRTPPEIPAVPEDFE